MSPKPNHPDDVGCYLVRVGGQLDDRWSQAFDGRRLVPQPDGTTSIECPDIDQAALHGLLRRIRDAGLPLISLMRQPTDN